MVKYGEGLDNKKRSDIFWHDNRINKDNIIIFFETDRNYINIFKFKTVLKKFKNRFHILLKANYILTNKLNNINLKKIL